MLLILPKANKHTCALQNHCPLSLLYTHTHTHIKRCTMYKNIVHTHTYIPHTPINPSPLSLSAVAHTSKFSYPLASSTQYLTTNTLCLSPNFIPLPRPSTSTSTLSIHPAVYGSQSPHDITNPLHSAGLTCGAPRTHADLHPTTPITVGWHACQIHEMNTADAN